MDKPPFEELRHLAENQPAAFEQLRAELVEDLIQNSDRSSQRRLRGLQFVIDARRDMAGNPMKALIEIQSMMHDSLDRLNQALRLKLGVNPVGAEYDVSHHSDNVVPLYRNEPHP